MQQKKDAMKKKNMLTKKVVSGAKKWVSKKLVASKPVVAAGDGDDPPSKKPKIAAAPADESCAPNDGRSDDPSSSEEAEVAGGVEAAGSSHADGSKHKTWVSGEWEHVAWGFGHMRFSAKRQHLDAHCGPHHESNCKMDRVLSKAPLGLCAAWLQARCDCKNAHDREKYFLSQADKMAVRNKARMAFRRAAAKQGGIMQKIVDAEKGASAWSGAEPLEFKDVKLVAVIAAGPG